MKNILFTTIVFIALAAIYLLYLKTNTYFSMNRKHATPDEELLTSADDLNSDIELTVRLTVTPKIMANLYCDLLRSATVFWNGKYGDVVLILDEEDKAEKLPHKLNALGLPFYFRGVYEKAPEENEKFVAIGTKHSFSYGYVRMLYSSFLMDQYTTASVIAWMDSDAILTMPIVNQSIFRNGKLIVKGANTFDYNWLPQWDHSTTIALGMPIVADFMSYFPVYIHPSTIKNCRQFIQKRLNAETFEQAFIQMSFEKVSPVNVILSYAYYYERFRYEWHIDIGTKMALHQYNEWRLPKYPLLPSDVKPELHSSVHAAYYKSKVDPLERAICYTQIHLGMTVVKHCADFFNKTNTQLFEFQTDPVLNHLDTWCKPPNDKVCDRLVTERYKMFADSRPAGLTLDTSKIKVIENSLLENYNRTCTNIRYVPFK